MRILKIILFSILGIIILLLLVGLFVKKEYVVTRHVTIEKPKSLVYNYVKYLKNQDNFSKWAALDPNMKKTYRGTDATVGFVSAWEGNKQVGKGEQEILSLKENERIDYGLRFQEPFEDKAHSYISFVQAPHDATNVVWSINGKMPYPMNLMLLFMSMDKQIGGDLETGLSNLKRLLENTAAGSPTQ